MFGYIKQLIYGSQDENKIEEAKQVLKTVIVRKRFLRLKNAAKEIQSFYRYQKNRRMIKKSQKEEGFILRCAYNLKQRYLMKMRCGQNFNKGGQINKVKTIFHNY